MALRLLLFLVSGLVSTAAAFSSTGPSSITATPIYINEVPQYSRLDECAETRLSTIVRNMASGCGDGGVATSFACFCLVSSARFDSIISTAIEADCSDDGAQGTSARDVFSNYCSMGVVDQTSDASGTADSTHIIGVRPTSEPSTTPDATPAQSATSGTSTPTSTQASSTPSSVSPSLAATASQAPTSADSATSSTTSSRGNDDDNTTTIVVAVAVPVIILLIATILLFIFRKRLRSFFRRDEPDAEPKTPLPTAEQTPQQAYTSTPIGVPQHYQQQAGQPYQQPDGRQYPQQHPQHNCQQQQQQSPQQQRYPSALQQQQQQGPYEIELPPGELYSGRDAAELPIVGRG